MAELVVCRSNGEIVRARDEGPSTELVDARFLAPVRYVQPEYRELQRRFDWVNPAFNGRCFREEGYSVSRISREVPFEYVHLNRFCRISDVRPEIYRRGLRPAQYEELLGFADRYPDEPPDFPVVALGSVTGVYGHVSSAVLWRGQKGLRCLDFKGFYRFFETYHRFLAVPLRIPFKKMWRCTYDPPEEQLMGCSYP